MRVQFVAKENGPERLVCDAEIVFGEDAGPLSGMKLVGFSLWRTADGDVYVTFPSRAFGVGNERKYYDYLRSVDWGRTSAYAVGIGSVYLNLRGREGEGIVAPAEALALSARVAEGLTGLTDPATGEVAVRGVTARDAAYRGPYAAESPDLVVRFAEGYRASWTTAVGGVPEGLIEDNVRRWSGDHIVDPELVPGVLLMNRPFWTSGARLVDPAPTILAALGVPRGAAMEGETLGL